MSEYVRTYVHACVWIEGEKEERRERGKGKQFFTTFFLSVKHLESRVNLLSKPSMFFDADVGVIVLG